MTWSAVRKYRWLQRLVAYPWWLAALVVAACLVAPPAVLQRLDMVLFEALNPPGLNTAPGALPSAHADASAITLASLAAQLAVGLAPFVLLMAFSRWGREREIRQAGWLLGLCAFPLAWTVVALDAAQAWFPPTAATLGWLLAYAMWRQGHSRDALSDLDRVRRHAGATLEAISDAVYTVDEQLRVMLMNPVAAQWSGLQAGDVGEGRALLHLLRLGAQDRDRLCAAIDSALRTGHAVELPQPIELPGRHHRRVVEVTASPIAQGRHGGAHGNRERAVVVMKDVTDRMLAAERLQHEATHDMLTGLPNRTVLGGRVEAALARCHAYGGHLAVLFIDLDRFKRINESLGHQHGDAVLALIARRLESAAGEGATIVRWGGDEFVVLLDDLGDAMQAHGHALAVAQRLMQSVETQIHLDKLDVHCTCSIGVALGPDEHAAATLDGLLTAADLAMRRGKVKGGHRIETAPMSDHGVGELVPWQNDPLTLENRLRQALAAGELELHYQPQLDLASSEPVGLEALLRWRQSNGVVWLPAQFLNVAEESSLILDIGAWAIREATHQLARWRDAGLTLLPVSINVSARQCLDRRLVQVVSQALAEHHIPAALLKLEITETTAMTDMEQMQALLTELRMLGVGVAVDDFGTGYSSLAHLQRLPIDQIKIDQSFVRDISNDRQGAAIVRATIALAHELGVPVVAEGVERESQRIFLALHDCDMAQGFYFAKPLDGSETGDYLRDAQRANGTDGRMAPSLI